MTDGKKRRGVFSALLELLGEDLSGEPEGDGALDAMSEPFPAAVDTIEPQQLPAAPVEEVFIPAAPTFEPAPVVPQPEQLPPVSQAPAPAPPVSPPVEEWVAPAPSWPTTQQTNGNAALIASRIADDRKAALESLAAGPLGPDVLPAIVERLLNDPDVDIRLRSFEILKGAQPTDFIDLRRRAMLDPSDALRERAVLHASEDPSAIGDLIQHVGFRRWPRTHIAATRAVAHMISIYGVTPEQLSALLSGVSQMAGSPLADDRSGIVALAAAITQDRLASSLSVPGRQRLGAALLLMEQGPSGIALVAGLGHDHSEDVRALAEMARRALPYTSQQVETPPVVAPPVEQPVFTPEPPPARFADDLEYEIIAGVARALNDPDPTVRSRANDALGRADRRLVIRWVHEQLHSGTIAEVIVAGQVVQDLQLAETAPDLLERAAGLPADSRALLAGVFTALHIEPAEYPALIARTDPLQRADAIRFVAEVGGAAVWPYLRPFLKDPSGPVRLASLEVIGETGLDSAEVAEGALTQDSSPAVRAAAIKAIARGRDADRKLRALETAFADADPDVRATAVEALLPGLGPAGFETALAALDDPDDRVRSMGMRYLGEVVSVDPAALWSAFRRASTQRRSELLSLIEELVPEQLADLAAERIESSDVLDRALAVELAVRSRSADSVRLAIHALQDPDAEVRRTAASGLTSIRTPTAIPALAAALKDPSSQVRAEAVLALGDIDDQTVIPVVITALKDPDQVVRSRAAHVLERWKSPAVAQYLVDSLSSPDLRRAAADILISMGDTAVVPLVDALQGGQQEVVSFVGKMLGEIVGPEPFVAELNDLNPARRLRAVEALGAVGGYGSVDALIEALSDPDERVRVRALVQLARLRDPRSLEAILRTFAGDPVLEVVRAAEAALRRIEAVDEVQAAPPEQGLYIEPDVADPDDDHSI